jgi:hypothetical protein
MRYMKRLSSLSTAAKLTVGGLVLAAVGITLERLTGSLLYPTLLLPIVLLVGAVFVAFGPIRWTRYVGLILAIVLAAGLVVSAVLSRSFLDQLTGLDTAGLLLGSLAHVLGLIAALAGGIGMVFRHEARQAQG